MITTQKQTDERREAGPVECWCLHGSVGMAGDFRGFSKVLAQEKVGSHAVDLWRFLACGSLPIGRFGEVLNAEVRGRVSRCEHRMLLGYSMGGRLALHALLEKDHPWKAAVIVSAHPGLEDSGEREVRRRVDAQWAVKALTGGWQAFMEEWNGQSILGGDWGRDVGMQQGLLMQRREVARSFVDWSLGAQEPLWERLGEIQVPVLWVVGEEDWKYRSLGERAVSLLPNARLLVVPGAGHRVPLQASECLAREVASFSRMG